MSDSLKQTGKRLVFVLAVLLFLAGVLRIFALRFEKGDIYPPGSSFRSDSLGCRALHDALVHTGRVEVRRNVRPVHRLDAEKKATVLVANMDPWALGNLPLRSFEFLDGLVKHGGRLVLCYRSEKTGSADPRKNQKVSEKKTGNRDTLNQDGSGDGETSGDARDSRENTEKPEKGVGTQSPGPAPGKTLDAARSWGFKVQMTDGDERSAQPTSVFSKKWGLKAQNWRASFCFTNRDPAWKPVYTLDGRVVLMERTLGEGSLVLASDSAFLTNGALKNNPNPALLAFVLGSGSTVIFEESHFGIRSELGVTGLLKRFGLQNVVWALVLFCLLYVWKNVGYFVPPRDEDGAGTVSDRDQASGLASLYKRHIPAANLISVCVREWAKTVSPGKDVDEAVKQQIRDLAAGKDGSPPDPVDGYRKITKLLSERKTL